MLHIDEENKMAKQFLCYIATVDKRTSVQRDMKVPRQFMKKTSRNESVNFHNFEHNKQQQLSFNILLLHLYNPSRHVL